MSQRPFSFILSKRSFSLIRPSIVVLLLLVLRVEGGYAQYAFTLTPTSAYCGLANGEITVTINSVPPGVVAPFTYYLFPPSGMTVVSTTGDFTGLAGGATYGFAVLGSGIPILSSTQYYTLFGSSAPTIGIGPLGATAALCASNIGTIQVVYTGGGQAPISYALGTGPYGQIGATTAAFSNLAAGAYTVNAKDNNGCITPLNVIVPLSFNLTLTMANDLTICQGTDTVLKPITNATIFAWTPATGLSNTTIADPIASPSVTTTYTLSDTLGVCYTSGTQTVNVLAAPIAAAVSPVGTCYGKSVELQGSGGVSYQWSPSTYLSNPQQQDPIMENPHSSETYKLMVVDANGCSSLEPATVVVNVVPPLKVFAGDDTSVVVGQTIPLNAIDVNNGGFNQYLWTPASGLSNANIADPTATVSESITYILTATAPDGCQGVDSITIKAFTLADIFVPNAFTPNNDGHNDLLHAIPIGIKEFKYFTVYNRYGQQVFATTNASLGWDGTLSGNTLLPGTFVWVAAGVDYTGRLVQRKGTVILIR